VEDLGGSEYWQAAQANAQSNARVVIRFEALPAGFDTSWRIRDVHTGELFDVESVLSPDHRYGINNYVEIMVRKSDGNDQ
jgi:hypothetical protein